MEHIRLNTPETIEDLHELQHELLDADPDDPRFLDPVPGSVDDIRRRMTQLCGGTLPPNLHVIVASSFPDFTHQFSDLVEGERRHDETGNNPTT